ncbi:hypothetical protein GCM10028856_13190 [Halopiger thermotolerans]
MGVSNHVRLRSDRTQQNVAEKHSSLRSERGALSTSVVGPLAHCVRSRSVAVRGLPFPESYDTRSARVVLSAKELGF